MGVGRDLFGLHKDGSQFPVEIGLNPIDTEEGTWVLSAIVDISERKRADESKEKLEAQVRHAQKLESLFVSGAPSVEQAVAESLAEYGDAARIAVIPKGPYVLAQVA